MAVAGTVSAMELRNKLGEILDRVALRHDRFLIERRGRPLAALVPAEVLEQLEGAAARLLIERQSRTARTSQSEADELADEAKHQTRPARGR